MDDNLDLTAKLAETISSRCFGSLLPAAPEVVVEAALIAIPALREADEGAVQLFADRLLIALRARVALENSTWAN